MFIQFFIQVRQNPLNLRINVSYVNYRILSLFCHGLDCEAIILFLMVFYTEVWGVNPAVVGTLFAVSRVIDAFTDATMVVIVDKVPVREDGKFRPWIIWIMGPIALASFIMYHTGLSDISMTAKIILMYVTHIIWGSITYTAINIPYGSMASAITSDPNERTELSIWRTRGQVIGQMFVGVLTPFNIYRRKFSKTRFNLYMGCSVIFNFSSCFLLDHLFLYN